MRSDCVRDVLHSRFFVYFIGRKVSGNLILGLGFFVGLEYNDSNQLEIEPIGCILLQRRGKV